MTFYQALCAVTVTIHISVPSPTIKNPANYDMAGCTGVFVSPTEILTAGHCVALSRGHQWIKTDDNKHYTVSIIKTDLVNDLALLKVTKPIYHEYVVLGNPVNPSDNIYTVNSGDGIEKTFNRGIVNNIYKDEDTHTLTILHNAAILPGASGSGLFNAQRELIGINTAMIKSFGVAVDIYEIRLFLNRR